MYCMRIPFAQVHALLAALLASLHDAPARGRLRRCSTHGIIGDTRDERQFEKKEALAGLLDARHARRPAPSERRRARRSSIRIRACVGDQRLYEVHVGDQQDCGCRRRFNTEGRATDRCFEHGRRRFDRRAGDRVQLRARVV
jgi:hypothetical protein